MLRLPLPYSMSDEQADSAAAEKATKHKAAKLRRRKNVIKNPVRKPRYLAETGGFASPGRPGFAVS